MFYLNNLKKIWQHLDLDQTDQTDQTDQQKTATALEINYIFLLLKRNKLYLSVISRNFLCNFIRLS